MKVFSKINDSMLAFDIWNLGEEMSANTLEVQASIISVRARQNCTGLEQ